MSAELAAVDCNECYHTDANLYYKFYGTFLRIYDGCFPVVNVRVKKLETEGPFMTRDIKNPIASNHKIYKNTILSHYIDS